MQGGTHEFKDWIPYAHISHLKRVISDFCLQISIPMAIRTDS